MKKKDLLSGNNTKKQVKKSNTGSNTGTAAHLSSFFRYSYSNSQNETEQIQEENFFGDTFVNSPVHQYNKQNKPNTWCYSITPVHLKNLEIICKIFGRSRYTVKQWAKDGAPIVYDGISYISEYNALFSWLLDYYRNDTA